MSCKITILTESIPTFAENIRKLLFCILKPIKMFLNREKTILYSGTKLKYGGHPAVTRSLIEGLQKLNANFNYNPLKFEHIGDVVIVLSGIKALKQAIKFKKKGKIKKLLAGPNLMVYGDDEDNILASSEIDICLVPSNTVKNNYETDNPELVGKIKVWPAGIDETYWSPVEKEKYNGRNVLIYQKNANEQLYFLVEDKLKYYHWDPIKIIYGRYKPDDFKKYLSKSRFAVFLSQSESQGIALAEAWAMNVPTLSWNPQEPTYLNNKKIFHDNSSCSFLSKDTGLEWRVISDFENILKKINELIDGFEPRKWVLSNMTDTVTSKCLINIVGNI